LRICFFCKSPTGIHLKEHRLSLCPTCYPSWVEDQVAKTIKRFKMFVPQEKILLAVSGGKDSLSLWQILTRLGYVVHAFYISLGIKEENYSDISKEKCLIMAQKLSLPLHIVDLQKESGYNLNQVSKAYYKTCSACGVIKRYFMNQITLKENYSVVATGHNLDDEVSTLFGNVLRWDETYLNRQYPVIPPKAGLAKKVKPLIFLSEKQVALYALTSEIDYIRHECPYSTHASSLRYKENLHQLESYNAGTLRFFLTNFLNFRKKQIKEQEEKKEIKEVALYLCSSCQQLSTSKMCKYCSIMQKVAQRAKKNGG